MPSGSTSMSKRRKRPLSPAELEREFDRGVKLHERGQYTQSRLAYKTVLASAPDHPDALHMGGLVAFQLGDHREALMLIRKAIQSRPHVAAYRNSYAEVLRQSGDLALLARHFPVTPAPTITCSEGERISSTRIRALCDRATKFSASLAEGT